MNTNQSEANMIACYVITLSWLRVMRQAALCLNLTTLIIVIIIMLIMAKSLSLSLLVFKLSSVAAIDDL